MICPKCGYDAGEHKFCPECGEKMSDASSTSESSEEIVSANVVNPKKAKDKIKEVLKNKKIVAAILAFIVLIGIIGIVNSLKPAPYVDWTTLFNEYYENSSKAQRKYKNKELTFYIRVNDFRTETNIDIDVVYTEDWEWDKGVIVYDVSVSFKNLKEYSEIRPYTCYQVEGKIKQLNIGNYPYSEKGTPQISSVSIVDAKVISER